MTNQTKGSLFWQLYGYPELSTYHDVQIYSKKLTKSQIEETLRRELEDCELCGFPDVIAASRINLGQNGVFNDFRTDLRGGSLKLYKFKP